jgi:hypothetical protein
MLKIIIATGVLAVVRLADAQQAIFLVRHAEDVRSKDVVDRPFTVQYYDHHKRTPFSIKWNCQSCCEGEVRAVSCRYSGNILTRYIANETF